MPNWCSNKLYVTGDRVAIADFIKRVTNTPEKVESGAQKYDILDNLYPCPEELINTKSGFFGNNQDGTKKQEQIDLEAKQKQNIAKYGSKDWYDWCNTNWGTKWGDSDTYLQGAEGDEDIYFEFQSAWSPPMEGIAHIATMFPTLKFALTYCEEGMDFYGLTTFDGEGDYMDDCESISEIEGMEEVDWDSDDYEKTMNKNSELLGDAQEQLLTEAGW